MNNTISHDLIENRTISPIMTIEGKRMEITATELKKNLGKYLEMAEKEDVLITKNGKIIAVLKGAENDITYKLSALYSFIGSGISPDGKGPEYTDEEIKEMCVAHLVEKYENTD